MFDRNRSTTPSSVPTCHSPALSQAAMALEKLITSAVRPLLLMRMSRSSACSHLRTATTMYGVLRHIKQRAQRGGRRRAPPVAAAPLAASSSSSSGGGDTGVYRTRLRRTDLKTDRCLQPPDPKSLDLVLHEQRHPESGGSARRVGELVSELGGVRLHGLLRAYFQKSAADTRRDPRFSLFALTGLPWRRR